MSQNAENTDNNKTVQSNNKTVAKNEQKKKKSNIAKLINLVVLVMGYMAAFFRQVKIGVLTLTLEKKQ